MHHTRHGSNPGRPVSHSLQGFRLFWQVTKILKYYIYGIEDVSLGSRVHVTEVGEYSNCTLKDVPLKFMIPGCGNPALILCISTFEFPSGFLVVCNHTSVYYQLGTYSGWKKTENYSSHGDLYNESSLFFLSAFQRNID